MGADEPLRVLPAREGGPTSEPDSRGMARANKAARARGRAQALYMRKWTPTSRAAAGYSGGCPARPKSRPTGPFVSGREATLIGRPSGRLAERARTRLGGRAGALGPRTLGRPAGSHRARLCGKSLVGKFAQNCAAAKCISVWSGRVGSAPSGAGATGATVSAPPEWISE